MVKIEKNLLWKVKIQVLRRKNFKPYCFGPN